jgi:hypothetical protein
MGRAWRASSGTDARQGWTDGLPRMEARRLVARRCAPQDSASEHESAAAGAPRQRARSETGPGGPASCAAIRAYGRGQSVHPPRLRAVAGTAAISWRRWSERSVTFSVPGASWSSVASCVEVTGRGWRAAITSSTACWRAVS